MLNFRVCDVDKIVLPTESDMGCAHYWGAPVVREDCWLRAPGSSTNFAPYLSAKSKVRQCNVKDILGIRPLFISNAFSGLEKRQRILINNTPCMIVGFNAALADVVVTFCKYSDHNCNYDESEIKALLFSDEFKELL